MGSFQTIDGVDKNHQWVAVKRLLNLHRQNYNLLQVWFGHPQSPTNTFTSLLPPPIRVQRWRNPFCGIHSATIYEHAVVGRRLHQADNDGARGLILHRCSPSCPSDYANKPRRAHQSPAGTQDIPSRTRNQRACALAYGGTTTFCSRRVCFSP